VAIDAVEFDEYRFIPVGCGNLEALAIPSDAARQSASTRGRGILLAEFTLYTPIMWQIEPPPFRVIEVRLLTVGGITQVEGPVFIETGCSAGSRICMAGD